ncbi:MAG TPA: hypothetical protein VIT38_17105 [Allosphingosinicella sp.]
MTRQPILLAVLTLLTGCLDDMCGNRVLDTVASPDWRQAAVIFERDCGATTRASTQVSILPAGEVPSEAGNVFVAETDTGSDPSRTRGPGVEVAWLGPNQLRIRYPRSATIFKRLEERVGVQITYGLSDAGD